MGTEELVYTSSQVVNFSIELSQPFHRVKWFKDGKQLYSGRKYRISEEEQGEKHVLEVNSVTVIDEGVYTFKILDEEKHKYVKIRG